MVEIYMDQQMWTEALNLLEVAEKGQPDEERSWSRRAVVYAAVGRTNDARAILEKLLNLRKEGKAEALDLAEVYYGLGDDEAAVKMLEQAHAERSSGLTTINWKPFWKPLREHEGVQRILKKLNLTDTTSRAIPEIPQLSK